MLAVADAVAVATATGVFFGVYPARRASHLQPIDALWYEYERKVN
jgi:ABC-type antimicrobial peptide transport system permease subunit